MLTVNHKSVRPLAVLAILFTTAKTLMAQPPIGAGAMPPKPPPFSFFDKNGDGVVTLEEFRRNPIPDGEHDAVLANIDANSDGVLTELEFINHVPPGMSRQRGAPSFDYLDIDGDGILTLAEFKSIKIPEGEHDTVFSGIDARGDGIITRREFVNHRSPPKEGRDRPAFEHIDLDGNGILTLSEFSNAPVPEGRHENIFEIIDENGDGMITEDEFKNHKPPMHENASLPPPRP